MKTMIRVTTIGAVCAALAGLFGLGLLAAPRGEVASAAEKSVTLQAYGGTCASSVTLNDDGTLPALPTPVREGYDFIGWFTQEVETEWWSDGAEETWQNLKAKYGNNGYQYLNGKTVEWYNAGEQPGAGSSGSYDWENSRWIEGSVGFQSATKGEKKASGDAFEGGTLYAMYDAKNIEIIWHSNGWQGIYDSEYASTGISTGTEYGGKFGYVPIDVWKPWSGHTFKGWMMQDGTGVEFDLNTWSQESKDFYKPATYQPVLHLFAKYDDVNTVVMQGDTVAKLLSTSGNGSYFDPKMGAGYLTLNFDTRYKTYPEISWSLTGDTAGMFDISVSADKRNATITVKAECKDSVIANTAAYVTVKVGEETYDLSVIASHQFDNGKTIQWGGCETEYIVKFTCTVCGATKERTYEPDGHRYTYYTHPATCTEDATRDRICVICGKLESEVLANTALGHNYQTMTVSNCLGTTVTSTCTRCGDCEESCDHIPVHSWEQVTTKAATCTAAGSATVRCSSCGTVKETKELPATGHRYTERTVAPTCNESGYVVKTCSACGDSSRETKGAPLGHSMTSETIVGCGNVEVTVNTCSRCGYSETIGDLSATEHSWASGYTVDVEPTCETEGVRSIHCTKCGATKGSERIPATGHSYGDWQIEEPTYTQNGSKSRSCLLCGETETEILPMLTRPEPQPEPQPEPVPEPQPEIVEPKVEEPKVEEPEVEESEVEEPEIDEPEIDEPEIDEPEVKEPEIDEPEVKEPEVDEPEVEEPEVNEPEVEEPEIDEPEVDEPEVQEPEIETEPEVEAEPEVEEVEPQPEQRPKTEASDRRLAGAQGMSQSVAANEAVAEDSHIPAWIAGGAAAVAVLGAALFFLFKRLLMK